MIWTTPKTDWAPADLYDNVAQNKVESNLAALSLHLRGGVSRYYDEMSAGNSGIRYVDGIIINVPTGKSVFAYQTHFYSPTYSDYFTWKVDIGNTAGGGGATPISETDNYISNEDILIYENATEEDVEIVVIVGIDPLVMPPQGERLHIWDMKLKIVDTP